MRATPPQLIYGPDNGDLNQALSDSGVYIIKLTCCPAYIDAW